MAKTILIVDDEAAFRDIFGVKLKAAGYEIATAENGVEGLKKLRELKPDLMMLDMQMPQMNGAETLEKIKTDPNLSGVKVVFLTNYSDPDSGAIVNDQKFAKEVGALDYIKKTDDLDSIVLKVKKILG